jgi:hypothetical protein
MRFPLILIENKILGTFVFQSIVVRESNSTTTTTMTTRREREREREREKEITKTIAWQCVNKLFETINIKFNNLMVINYNTHIEIYKKYNKDNFMLV